MSGTINLESIVDEFDQTKLLQDSYLNSGDKEVNQNDLPSSSQSSIISTSRSNKGKSKIRSTSAPNSPTTPNKSPTTPNKSLVSPGGSFRGLVFSPSHRITTSPKISPVSINSPNQWTSDRSSISITPPTSIKSVSNSIKSASSSSVNTITSPGKLKRSTSVPIADVTYDGSGWTQSKDNQKESIKTPKRTKSKVVAPSFLRSSTPSQSNIINGNNIASLDELVSETSNSRMNKSHIRYYPQRKIALDDDKYTEFWNGYCSLANNDYSNNDLSIGELVNTNNIPLVIDIYLLFDESPDDYYPFTVGIVGLLQQIITNRVVVGETRSELACIVLDSGDCELDNGDHMVRLRLYFPYTRVSRGFIDRVVIGEVAVNIENVLDRLEVTPKNDGQNMIFNPYHQNSLPMYHSRVNPREPRLSFYHAFDQIPSEVLDDSEVIDNLDEYNLEIDLETVFPLEVHSHINTQAIDLDQLNSDDNDYDYWLPLILSVHYWTTSSVVHTSVSPATTPTSALIDSTDNDNEEECQINDKAPMYMARQLLPLIKRYRYQIEHSWLAIGESLFTASDGKDVGRNWWIRETVAAGTFNEESCDTRWNSWLVSADLKYCTFRTLAYFASKDNEKKYNEWHRDWCKTAMIRAASCSDSDVAEALYRCYFTEFAVVPSGRSWNWYRFDQHHWIPMSNASHLMRRMNGDFQNRIQAIITSESRRVERMSADDPNKQGVQSLINRLSELVKRLNKRPFKRTILGEVADIFHDNDSEFATKRDTIRNLTGLRNGVIEAGTMKARFRPGKPEDYITKYSPVRYDNKLNWKSKTVIETMEWFRQCFMDEELIECFLRLSSSFLISRNIDKIFAVFSGKEGDNSKSKIKKLFDIAFGPSYSVAIDESVITDNNRSGGPSPETARMGGAKICWFIEPDEDSPLKNNKLKKFSGDDTYYARNCNENGGDILPTFVPIIMCNKVPLISGSERAVHQRLKIFPFLSRWSNNAPKSKEEQYRLRIFPMDKHFDLKLPNLAPAALWIFVQKYADYCRHGLGIPDIVKRYTRSYWEETDSYNIFRRDCIEVKLIPGSVDEEHPKGIIDPTASVSVSDVYQRFIAWYQDNLPGIKIPLRPTMTEELSRRWKSQPHEGRWHGIGIRDEELDM